MKKTSILFVLLALIFSNLLSQKNKSVSEIKQLVKEYNLIEARTLINKALNSNNTSPQTRAQLWETSGEISIRLGNYEESLIHYAKAKTIWLELKDKKKYARTLGEIGIAEWKLGNIVSANDNLKQSASIQESQNLNFELAKTYNNLGLISSENNPEDALSYYKKSLSLYEKNKTANQDLFLITQNNIAIVNRTLGNFTTALELFQKTYETLNKTPNKKDFQIAFTEANIAQTHLLLHDTEQALTYYKKSLNVYKKVFGETHPEVANIHYQIARIHSEEGNLNQALSEIERACEVNTKDKNARIYFDRNLEISILHQNAEILLKKYYTKTLSPKNVKEALSLLMLSDTLIQQQRNFLFSKNDKITFNEKAREVFECEMECLTILNKEPFAKKRGYQDLIFNLIEKSKASTLLSSLQDAKAKKFSDIPEEITLKEKEITSKISSLETDLLAQDLTEEKAKTIKSKLSLERTSYTEFIKLLEVKYPNYFELKYSQTVITPGEVQELLTEEEMLVNYFISERENSIIAFKITKKKCWIETREIALDTKKQIIYMNNCIKFDLPKGFKTSSNKIAHQIMLDHTPEKYKKLNIIPDGFLNGITYEALIKKTSKDHVKFHELNYLILSHEVNYHFSSSLWSQSKLSENDKSFHTMAPIYFEKNHDFSDLPGTKVEVEKLDSMFKQHSYSSISYLESKAIEKNLKHLTKGHILHIPTHGQVYSSSPEKSNLLLSKNDSTEDGHLYMGEIYNSTFNYNLISLSACETGIGKQSKGEGVIGLSRAFIYAGAQNIIVSYWKVDDYSTVELMANFYDHYLKTDQSFSKSLQVAKKKMISDGKYSNPHYWAPFVLIGKN